MIIEAAGGRVIINGAPLARYEAEALGRRVLHAARQAARQACVVCPACGSVDTLPHSATAELERAAGVALDDRRPWACVTCGGQWR